MNYIIGSGQRWTDPDKISAMQEMAMPVDKENTTDTWFLLVL